MCYFSNLSDFCKFVLTVDLTQATKDRERCGTHLWGASHRWTGSLVTGESSQGQSEVVKKHFKVQDRLSLKLQELITDGHRGAAEHAGSTTSDTSWPREVNVCDVLVNDILLTHPADAEQHMHRSLGGVFLTARSNFSFGIFWDKSPVLFSS